MKTTAKPVFQHLALFGQSAQQCPDKEGPIGGDFTFNSPVGVGMDHCQRLWVCDTGNNRVLVLDKDLKRIIRVLVAPASGSDGAGSVAFRMPFHICPHPEKNLLYITDMGNARVVVMEYDDQRIDFAFVFGNSTSNGGLPLQDPNGIAAVRGADGSYHIHVNDEFFHTEADKLRNRCVRYDEQGQYIDEFRGVIEPDGTRHELYWPQGLSADTQGNLYLANTGNYEILKCAADAPVDADYYLQAKEALVSHKFGQPSGLGMMNIMRSVAAIGERVFVPDHVLNTISVYSPDGQEQTRLCGTRPSWNHGAEAVHSLSDPLYYAAEEAMLLNPYAVCQGEAADIFFVSEPFSSRIVKLRVADFRPPQAPMEMLAALGARRDQPGNGKIDPQFNCVSGVAGLLPPTRQPDPVTPEAAPDLPAYLKYNPFQYAYQELSRALTRQYGFWFGDWSRQMLAASGVTDLAAGLRLTVDAGNWRFKGYEEDNGKFTALTNRLLDGYFLPGNLALTVHHPKEALLGQLCPGTPILFVGNFNFGTISMYQVDPLGRLLNYGVPFASYGTTDGCLRGPQGMAVSDDGEIYIVDSLNNRMAKWRILQTGQVVFIRNFVWNEAASKADPAAFTPTDVALDGQNRVVVTDQFNNRICFFDRDGTPLWCCGHESYWEEGDPDGEKFILPTSLAIDGDFLIVNDLVNRALKLFRIGAQSLTFVGGISLFKLSVQEGGVWMPFFMYARDGQVFIADSTYNIVQVFKY